MKSIYFQKCIALLLMAWFITSCASKKPEACFSSNKYGAITINDEIKLNATCSENGNAYLWDYGDGTTGDGPQVAHRFDAAGSYTIKLMVCSHGLSSSREQTVVVSQ